jgi:hypothetical protein
VDRRDRVLDLQLSDLICLGRAGDMFGYRSSIDLTN